MVCDRCPNNYVLSFELTLLSTFKEFQVAFRHESLFKRLRFRIVDGNTVVFEIVVKGIFFNSFISKPIELDKEKLYHIQVMVYNTIYALMIDGEAVLAIESTNKDFIAGDMAIVFWDDKEKSNINAIISELKICEIK